MKYKHYYNLALIDIESLLNVIAELNEWTEIQLNEVKTLFYAKYNRKNPPSTKVKGGSEENTIKSD